MGNRYSFIEKDHLQEQETGQMILKSNITKKQISQMKDPMILNQSICDLSYIKYENLTQDEDDILTQNQPSWFYCKLTKYFTFQFQQKSNEKGLNLNPEQRLNKLVQLIRQYQYLTQKQGMLTKQHQTRKLYPVQIQEAWGYKELTTAVQLFTQIINIRKNTFSFLDNLKQIQKIYLVWKSQENYSGKYIYENYVKYNKRNSSIIDLLNEEDFFEQYWKYVTSRYQEIIQKIISLNSNLLPRYYKIQKHLENKIIKFEMERGLVFPILINPQQFMFEDRFQYVGYNKFLSKLPQNIQMKFIKEIYQNIAYLYSNGIQHNDVRMKNVIYSIIDDRFKLIDHDISKLNKKFIKDQTKTINFTIYQCLNQCIIQQQVVNQLSYQILNQASKDSIQDSIKNEQDIKNISKLNISNHSIHYYKYFRQRSLIQPLSLKQIELILNHGDKMNEFIQKSHGIIDLKMFGQMLLKLFYNIQGQAKEDQFKLYFEDTVKKFLKEDTLQDFKILFSKNIQFCLNDVYFIVKNNYREKVLQNLIKDHKIQQSQNILLSHRQRQKYVQISQNQKLKEIKKQRDEKVPLQMPYLCVVQVVSILEKVTITSSGTIIKKNIVLTVAHAVYSKNLRQEAIQIYVNVRTQTGLKKVMVIQIKYPQVYKQRNDQKSLKYDLCYLKLQQNNIISQKYVIPLKFGHKDKQKQFQIIGFKAQEAQDFYKISVPKAIYIYENKIRYMSKTYSGMSGGPLILKQSGVFKCIGMHQGQGYHGNAFGVGLVFTSQSITTKKILKQLNHQLMGQQQLFSESNQSQANKELQKLVLKQVKSIQNQQKKQKKIYVKKSQLKNKNSSVYFQCSKSLIPKIYNSDSESGIYDNKNRIQSLTKKKSKILKDGNKTIYPEIEPQQKKQIYFTEYQQNENEYVKPFPSIHKKKNFKIKQIKSTAKQQKKIQDQQLKLNQQPSIQTIQIKKQQNMNYDNQYNQYQNNSSSQISQTNTFLNLSPQSQNQQSSSMSKYLVSENINSQDIVNPVPIKFLKTNLLLGFGDQFFHKKNYSEATKWYSKYLSSFKNSNIYLNSTLHANGCSRMGDSLRMEKKYKEAIDIYQKQIDIRQQLQKSQEVSYQIQIQCCKYKIKQANKKFIQQQQQQNIQQICKKQKSDNQIQIQTSSKKKLRRTIKITKKAKASLLQVSRQSQILLQPSKSVINPQTQSQSFQTFIDLENKQIQSSNQKKTQNGFDQQQQIQLIDLETFKYQYIKSQNQSQNQRQIQKQNQNSNKNQSYKSYEEIEETEESIILSQQKILQISCSMFEQNKKDLFKKILET